MSTYRIRIQNPLSVKSRVSIKSNYGEHVSFLGNLHDSGLIYLMVWDILPFPLRTTAHDGLSRTGIRSSEVTNALFRSTRAAQLIAYANERSKREYAGEKTGKIMSVLQQQNKRVLRLKAARRSRRRVMFGSICVHRGWTH